MSVFSKIFKALTIALAVSTFSFAALADSASKFLGNIPVFGEIPEDIFSFHTLLWGSQKPQWLGKTLDASETKKAWTDWIDAVKERYPDLEMIEVVNEAVKINNNNYHSGYTNSNLVEALGGDSGNYEFVVTAFKMARERWPKAILIYNDYNTIQWNKELAIDLVKKIKAQGAPIDAFGMQFHETTTQGSGKRKCLHFSVLKRALNDAHEQTGLPIYITQYDVDLRQNLVGGG